MQNAHQKDQVLVCWIGNTDLLVLGKYGRDREIERYHFMAKKVWQLDKQGTSHDFDTEITNLDLETHNSSIILTLEQATKNSVVPRFSEVLLLTNRPSGNLEAVKEYKDIYATFIGQSCPEFRGHVQVEFVPDAHDPNKGVDGWDYEAVYTATKIVLESYIKRGIQRQNIWYNVTPGTIAQSTSLILVGKELSQDSNFIQVEKSRKRVDHCQIPFNLADAIGNQISQSSASTTIIGKSPSFLAALNKAKRAALYPVNILLTGESGTGKEVFAHEIHRLSGRKGKFIAINCAMLSKETGVTELTGYFRGAYTDAKNTTTGKFHDAIDGTLFLDEIGDCPIDVQAELLRFLQPLSGEKLTARTWRLKGSCPSTNATPEETKYKDGEQGDILVIAATNKDLSKTERFREDLYFRLETIRIEMPSLELRKSESDTNSGIDDLKDLSDFFLAKCNKDFGFAQQQRKQFAPDAYETLREHRWTGNVRELQNAIVRAVVLSEGTTISADDIKRTIGEGLSASTSDNTGQNFATIVSALARSDINDRTTTLDERISEFKHHYCVAAREATNGNKKEAYSILKVAPKTFDAYLEAKPGSR